LVSCDDRCFEDVCKFDQTDSVMLHTCVVVAVICKLVLHVALKEQTLFGIYSLDLLLSH
jgi:hypothetical protein